jgi:Protein of unknown function (DUF4231)
MTGRFSKITDRFKVPLPPQATDSSSPEFLTAAEQYVRRIRDVYDKRAGGHRRYYRFTGISVIVAGASLPLLTSLNYTHKSLIISVVGVFVSAVTALRAFYRWDQMWALLRATEFAVSRVYWNWRGEVEASPFSVDGVLSPEVRKATVAMLTEVADIRNNEAVSFFKDLPFPPKSLSWAKLTVNLTISRTGTHR